MTGAAAAVLLAFGGLAQAEPEGASTIKACVNTRTGDVRIPNPPKGGSHGCGPFERSVLWNVKGPRGPQGPRGERGPRGPQGPAGLSGPGRSILHSETIPGLSAGVAVVASCPAGMVATGGGYVTPGDLTISSTTPQPLTGGPVTGWRVTFSNPSTTGLPGSVFAVCYNSAN